MKRGNWVRVLWLPLVLGGCAGSVQDGTGSTTAALTTSDLQAVVESLGTLVNVSVTQLPDLTTLPQRPSASCPSCRPNPDAVALAPPNPADWPQVSPVPGWVVTATIANDPESSFLMRIPQGWNGKMVVGGTGGVRGAFSNDIIISDYVLNKGYAYVGQNKGFSGQKLVSYDATDACPVFPVDDVPTRSGFNFFAWFAMLEPGNHLEEWAVRMNQAALTGRAILQGAYGKGPSRTYAMGASNGGYQVRRALEQDRAHIFDGGVDWEGVMIAPGSHSIIGEMNVGLRNYPAYRASGFDPNSTAAQNIRAADYPPDLVENNSSVWTIMRGAYWEVTECLFGRKMDPDYYSANLDLSAPEPYSIVESYDYPSREAIVAKNIANYANTGSFKAPLITVHGTLDSLVPIQGNSRPYKELVESTGSGDHYRLYEIQNGNHIDGVKAKLPDIVLMMPHAQHAFDLLEQWVEHGSAAPASQCVPKGSQISASFAETSCSSLLAQ